jgi:hypothetical protein
MLSRYRVELRALDLEPQLEVGICYELLSRPAWSSAIAKNVKSTTREYVTHARNEKTRRVAYTIQYSR